MDPLVQSLRPLSSHEEALGSHPGPPADTKLFLSQNPPPEEDLSRSLPTQIQLTRPFSVVEAVATGERRPAFEPMPSRPAGPLIPGYRTVQRLRVSSAEADLYLMVREADDQKVVLKLYRYGYSPKMEILEALRSLPPDHAVPIFEIGETDERLFEIQEYAEFGSLADLLDHGALNLGAARSLLTQLAEAVGYIHSANIIHRDLKPSNILIRAVQPLDVVLTDFGISSVAQRTLHVTSTSRTIIYGAPEAMTGVVAKASDWWALGVILLESITGHHPLRGKDDRQANFELVTVGIPVPTNLSPDWQMVLRGLLTRDASRRWSYAEVRAWLDGRRDIPVYYSEGSSAVLTPGIRPFRFLGEEFQSPETLAQEMCKHWEEAGSQVAHGSLLRWLEDDLHDATRSARLQEVLDDPLLPEDARVAAALLILSDELPLFWRAEIVSPAWMREHVNESVALYQTSLPAWVRRLRGDQRLWEMQQRYFSVLEEVNKLGVPVDRQVVDALLVSEFENVRTMWAERRADIECSTHPVLDQLVKKTDPSDVEIIALLACDPALLRTGEQVRSAQKRQTQLLIESYGFDLDWDLARELLHTPDWDRIDPLLAERRNEFVASSDPLLELFLKTDDIAYIDAVVLATADPRYFFSERPPTSRRRRSGVPTIQLPDGYFPVSALHFSHDARLLFCAGGNGRLCAWNLVKGEMERKFRGHEMPIGTMALSRDQNVLISAGGGVADNFLRIWDIGRGTIAGELAGPGNAINAVAISPGNEFIAAGGVESHVHVWDRGSGNQIAILPGVNQTVSCVAFSQEGRFLAVGTLGGRVQVWNIENGQIALDTGESQSVQQLLFSSDGSTLRIVYASPGVSSNVTIATWNLYDMSNESDRTFDVGSRLVAAQLPRHLRWLLVARANLLQIHNVSDGKLAGTFEAHDRAIRLFALSRDGTQACTAAEDGALAIWSFAELLA